MNPIRVAILIPHMGEWSAEFSDRVYGLLKFVPVAEFEKVMFTCRGLPVHVARNMLAETALGDPKVTHLFWIDSDVVPEMNPNEAILRLLMCNAPIVSGIYRSRQRQGFNLSAWMKHPEGYVPVSQFTGNWLTVSVIGFGCVLIQRHVFEKIPQPWFRWDSDKGPSEDFFFCELARQHGFEIKVFTDVKCSHISGMLKVMPDGSVTTLEV